MEEGGLAGVWEEEEEAEEEDDGGSAFSRTSETTEVSGLGLGLRPGFPLILGVVSSGLVPASLPSLLHLRTLLLEQLDTSRAGDGSAQWIL